MRHTLRTSQLFSQLDDASLAEIESAAILKKAVRNELIFNEGDPAGGFFVVGSGRVKIFKLSPDGKEQILMIAEPGDSFGEAAVFSGGKFPASAQALETTEMVMIDRGRFTSLMGRKPELAVSLIGRLSELLRKMTRLVEGLSLSDVNTRLARYLSQYKDESTGELPAIIRLTEKKSVLAAQLGTIPETLSRALAKMVKDKIIAVDGPDIQVLDPEALKHLADSGR